MLTSFKDEERRYIKPGAGKDVLHLVEDLDRVMAKHKATFQISPNSTTCEARKGKSTEKRWKKRKLAACESRKKKSMPYFLLPCRTSLPPPLAEDFERWYSPNAKFYRQLDGDITDTIQQRVTVYIERMFNDGYIDKKTKKYLVQTNVKPGRFYILPKIHKAGNPGRPIVLSNSHPTEHISQFVDYYHD